MTQTFNPPPLMWFIPDEGKQARRQRVAQLLEAILDERIEPRIAINRWPEPTKEIDPSVDCAYQALWHFEADEDKQKSELFYMDAQLELLRQIARHLQGGQDLPPHILALYRGKKGVRFFKDVSMMTESLGLVRKFWQEIQHIWNQALDLCFESRHAER